jgi:hypothetical protein
MGAEVFTKIESLSFGGGAEGDETLAWRTDPATQQEKSRNKLRSGKPYLVSTERVGHTVSAGSWSCEL